jgi:uncharacterized protein (TIGR00251 family)
MKCLTATSGGVILALRVVPRAAKDTIDGERDGALRIRLRAPPVEGQANRALVAFLAETLGVRRSDIALLCGETGRHKRARISGVTERQVLAKLPVKQPAST